MNSAGWFHFTSLPSNLVDRQYAASAVIGVYSRRPWEASLL
jgi:hypothetical protein